MYFDTPWNYIFEKIETSESFHIILFLYKYIYEDFNGILVKCMKSVIVLLYSREIA